MSRKCCRPIHLHVMVSEEELTLLQEHVAESGVQNMGAFVWKMALIGYVLHVDLGPMRKLVSLQRHPEPSGDPGQHLRRHIPPGHRLLPKNYACRSPCPSY